MEVWATLELESLATAADADLLDTLTHKLRVISEGQIARSLWTESRGGMASVRHRLKGLESRRLVICFRAEVHPEITLDTPVISSYPGCRAPDFAAASYYRLRRRWCRPSVSTRCVIATALAGRLYGGWGGRFPRESEETHDIHLAAVYLLLKKRDPRSADYWASEEAIRLRRGPKSEKLPDAIIDDPDARKIVEFGGAYSKKKLEAFHVYCSDLDLPYEVW